MNKMTTEQINEKAQEIVDILISHELSHDQMLDVLAMATIKLDNMYYNKGIQSNLNFDEELNNILP